MRLYVGSAFGPGGIKARVERHHHTNKPKHWHVDYLREYMDLISVWYSYDKQKLEHQWAQSLSGLSDMVPIHGFGCSDCQCYSHLFRAVKEPAFKQFSNNASGTLKLYTFHKEKYSDCIGGSGTTACGKQSQSRA